MSSSRTRVADNYPKGDVAKAHLLQALDRAYTAKHKGWDVHAKRMFAQCASDAHAAGFFHIAQECRTHAA